MSEDYRNEEPSQKHWEDRAPASATRWLVILAVLFFAAAIFGGGYIYEQSVATSDLATQNQSLHSTINQMHSQIDAMTTKLDQMSTPPPAPTPATQTATNGTANSSTAKRPASARPNAQDRRMKQMQTQLAEQQKQLKETQDEVATAKSDLEGKLGSTRDELNGSIAKTHDELVTLEKRGERSFYEFDLTKSKNFAHMGPIQVSLRKADTKHQSYDLMMLVDDHQLSKKKVNLYEPIWLHQSDQPQPVQVVVNKIEKDHIHGYVSSPKYRESELAATNGQASSGISGSSSNSSSNSTSSTSTPSSTSSTSSPTQAQPVN